MKVLAIIDMQKDFIDGALGTKEAVSIVPKVAARPSKGARRTGNGRLYARYAPCGLSVYAGGGRSCRFRTGSEGTTLADRRGAAGSGRAGL